MSFGPHCMHCGEIITTSAKTNICQSCFNALMCQAQNGYQPTIAIPIALVREAADALNVLLRIAHDEAWDMSTDIRTLPSRLRALLPLGSPSGDPHDTKDETT